MAIEKLAFVGDDNTFDLTFSSVNVGGVVTPFDFSTIYSVTMELYGSGLAPAEYTTLGAGNIVDSSAGSGVLRFRIGLISGLPVGTFILRLKIKTSIGDTNATKLAGEDTENEVTVEVRPLAALTLIVEDGTGTIADAASYMTVAEADTYHSARRNLAWSAAPVIHRLSALVRATDYIDTRWGSMFLGKRLLGTQSLLWPRQWLYDEFREPVTGIPVAIKRACAEYALRALAAPLAPDPVLNVNGKVTSVLERVEGAVTSEVHYAENLSPPILRPYPAADMLIRPFVISSSELLRA